MGKYNLITPDIRVNLTVIEGPEKGKPFAFAIGQNAEKRKKQRDPIAFILGDDKPMSIGKKISNLPTKLVTAIDLAFEKKLQKRTQTAQEFKKAIEVYSI